MVYNDNKLIEINEQYQSVKRKHKQLLLNLIKFQVKLKNDKARVYVYQGVSRRLGTLTRCLINIFDLFPPERTLRLSKDELIDVSINLHAFFINITGVFDNLGWVFVFENNLLGKPRDNKISRTGVGVFNNRTQNFLNENLREYLNQESILSWYKNYSKNYRDALAHRIPLYVPPSALNEAEVEEYNMIIQKINVLDVTHPDYLANYEELLDRQKRLGKVCMYFAHSMEEEGSPAFIHAQIICDFLTVEEVVTKFCEFFEV
jgi:hypothetical protein